MALLARIVQPFHEAGELSARVRATRRTVLSQIVESLLDAETFRVELQRASVAVGHDRFHLATGKRLTFGHRVGERLDTFQEFPVVGHQKAIIRRRVVRVPWAERPIFPSFRS